MTEHNFLDKVDRDILKKLQDWERDKINGTVYRLSQELKISDTTVDHKIRWLERRGYVKGLKLTPFAKKHLFWIKDIGDRTYQIQIQPNEVAIRLDKNNTPISAVVLPEKRKKGGTLAIIPDYKNSSWRLV
jgi:DNA-binding transcriptional MocR family regulator